MDILPIIAFMDARTAAARELRGARTDDPQERRGRRGPDPGRNQPSRKRSEKATRSTGGAKTGSPSKVTA